MRHALRLLGRNLGWTCASVLCLALGIGATSAIFSVVNAVVLRPLPYREPQQLLRIYSEFPEFPNGGLRKFWISPPEFVGLRQDTKAFETVDAWQSGGANLAGAGDPLRVNAAFVSGTLLPTLGVSPVRGRWLEPADDKEGAQLTAVIGYGLWQRAFGGDPNVVNKEVQFNGRACTIVGVMPNGFQFPPGEVDAAEIWAPLQLSSQDMQRWGNHRLYVMGRIKPGISWTQAKEDLKRLEEEQGKLAGRMTHRFHPKNHPIVSFGLLDETVGSVRPAMYALLAAVVFVLLIACGNVANLLLARAEARQREIAVRRAMGASAGTLVKQFLLEGLLLSGFGALLGLVFAYGGLRLILATSAGSIPRSVEVSIDGWVLLFTLAVSILTGVVFGLAPLAQSLRSAVHDTLKSAGGRTTATKEAHWLRNALVVGEIGLAMVLLVGAGLMLDAFWKLQKTNPGVNPENILTARLVLPRNAYAEDPKVVGFWQELQRRLTALPGVTSASIVGGLPPQRPINANDTQIEGYVSKPGSPPQNVDYYQYVGPKYFETMGIPLRDGRYLDERDGPGSPQSVVINEAMARYWYPGQNPIGRRVRASFDGEWWTIVGVVADAKNAGLEAPAGTELYFPLLHPNGTSRGGYVVIKTAGEPSALAKALRAEVSAIDPALPVSAVRTMEDVIGASRARPRFLTLLLSLFSGVALALAALGIYSVMAYAVTQRTNEFGIRMAMGAEAGDVLGLVLKQGMVLVGTGLLIGGAGALALNRSLKGAVYGIGDFRPIAVAAMAIVLIAVTLIACLFPARRATRVDPLVALRYE